MSKQAELNALVKAAEEALGKATAFADEHKLSFGWNVAYGMGGHYYGDPDDRNEDYDDNGWSSSSMGC